MVRAMRFVVLGGLFVVGSVLFALVFGITDTLLLLQVLLMGATGVLFVVGGMGYDLGSVEWYQLVGVGDVLLGLNLGIPILTALEGSGSLGGDLLFIGAAAIGGLSLAYMVLTGSAAANTSISHSSIPRFSPLVALLLERIQSRSGVPSVLTTPEAESILTTALGRILCLLTVHRERFRPLVDPPGGKS